jgi:hypothetical protein
MGATNIQDAKRKHPMEPLDEAYTNNSQSSFSLRARTIAQLA